MITELYNNNNFFLTVLCWSCTKDATEAATSSSVRIPIIWEIAADRPVYSRCSGWKRITTFSTNYNNNHPSNSNNNSSSSSSSSSSMTMWTRCRWPIPAISSWMTRSRSVPAPVRWTVVSNIYLIQPDRPKAYGAYSAPTATSTKTRPTAPTVASVASKSDPPRIVKTRKWVYKSVPHVNIFFCYGFIVIIFFFFFFFKADISLFLYTSV